MTDHTKLKELALAATPGPWEFKRKCADDLAENGDGEYSPGQGDRPKLQSTHS